jgi:apolipoprotein N-acyltransferase
MNPFNQPTLSLVPRDMIRGDKEKIFELGSYKLSTVISFEGSFQRYIRNSIQEGAEIIVILTNQASYGQSGMSEQFLLMSRANAISNDRPIIHSAITGKSAFIDNNGNILSDTDLFTSEILNESIQPTDSLTCSKRYD